MQICFMIHGVRHCFFVPVLEWPVVWHKPGPGPVNYPQILQDATILVSLQQLAKHIGNVEVARAVEHGFASGLQAMQKHVGDYAEIKEIGAEAAR